MGLPSWNYNSMGNCINNIKLHIMIHFYDELEVMGEDFDYKESIPDYYWCPSCDKIHEEKPAGFICEN